MSIESLYGIPGFYDFGEEVPKEKDDEVEGTPIEVEVVDEEEEAMLENIQGLFFDFREILDGVFEGQGKSSAAVADPETMRKALEQQERFLRQFAIA